MAREVTSRVIDMLDDGLLDPDKLVRDILVNWMSEDEVIEYYKKNLED